MPRVRSTEPSATAGEITDALGRFKPGDVLMLPGGRHGGPAAVLSTSWRRANDLRVRVLTPSRARLLLAPKDFHEPPKKIGQIELPMPYAPNSQSFQREVASRLHKARLSDLSGNGMPAGGGRRRSPGARATATRWPRCPDAQSHLPRLRPGRAARARGRAARAADPRSHRVAGPPVRPGAAGDATRGATSTGGRSPSPATSWRGCTTRPISSWPSACAAACFEGLGPAEAAGLASVFVYEARGPNPGPAAAFPTSRLRTRWADIERLARELHLAEEEAGLPLTRLPDPGFVAIAHAWADGHELEDVLEDEEVSGGDFVRVVKQLIDLLRQLGDVATEPATATAFRTAADNVFRGVIAASSVVGTGP